ncbi:ABC transporter permease [Rhodococcus sp. NPDC127528]|uniref:ABC transporter permease n=1 Tax=unclassified Rhodococcus (in: high G+C Gram-positive bacteria) TaxID=192944 RepID=UPI00363D143F
MNTKNLFSSPLSRCSLLLAAIIVALLVFQPTALGSYGIIAASIVPVWLVAVALVPVLVLGEIDLSVGSTMAVAAAVTSTVSPNLLVGVVCGALAGIVVGIVNGLLVAKVGISSFVATLATQITLYGLALAITSGGPVTLPDQEAAMSFAPPILGQITPAVLVAVAVSVAVWWTMARTHSGRDLFAIGGNRGAARAAGIPVTARTLLAFCVCGGISGLAGVLATIDLGAGSPNLGSTVVMLSIAAAVIGGANLAGGRASVVGAVLGAFALGSISIGLQMGGLDSSAENTVVGVILFLAIILTGQHHSLLQIIRIERARLSRNTSDALAETAR